MLPNNSAQRKVTNNHLSVVLESYIRPSFCCASHERLMRNVEWLF